MAANVYVTEALKNRDTTERDIILRPMVQKCYQKRKEKEIFAL